MYLLKFKPLNKPHHTVVPEKSEEKRFSRYRVGRLKLKEKKPRYTLLLCCAGGWESGGGSPGEGRFKEYPPLEWEGRRPKQFIDRGLRIEEKGPL